MKYAVTVTRIYHILVEAGDPNDVIDLAHEMSAAELRLAAVKPVQSDIEIRPERGSYHFPETLFPSYRKS